MSHKLVTEDIVRAQAHLKENNIDAYIIAATPAPIDPNIGRVNAHVTAFLLSDGRQTCVVDVAPKYYYTKDGFWRPLTEIAIHAGNQHITLDARKAWDQASSKFLRWLASRQFHLGEDLEYAFPYGGIYSGVPLHQYATMDTGGPFNPDADPESTSFDGEIEAAASTWNTVHDATTGTASATGATLIPGSRHVVSTYTITRVIELFDTSSLGGGTVSAGTVSNYCVGRQTDDNDGADTVQLVQSSPASTTGIAGADYNNVGDLVDNPTQGATAIDISSLPDVFTTPQYVDWTLNSTGIGWVNPTGITKLGFREGHDATDAPILTSSINRLNWNSADAGSNKPKLTVTYTPAYVPGPLGMFF